MNKNEPVTIGPWGIRLGSKLRLALLIVVGGLLGWTLLQTLWVVLYTVVWTLTHRY